MYALYISTIFPSPPLTVAITFVDWAPQQPDSSMGIWDSASVLLSSPVSVAHPVINTALLQDGAVALVSLGATLRAGTAGTGPTHTLLSAVLTAPYGTVVASVFGSCDVQAGNDGSLCILPNVTIPSPALWWPWQMGEPTLHSLQLNVTVGGVSSDSLTRRVGLREAMGELHAPKGGRAAYRLFSPILIRGAGWAPDLLLRYDAAHTRKEVRWVCIYCDAPPILLRAPTQLLAPACQRHGSERRTSGGKDEP